MINPIHVLDAVAGRPDCPPDIAAAILWSIQNLTVEEPVVAPATSPKETALTYPGRKHTISYNKALKVFNDWQKHGNIAQSAKRHRVTYSQAWNVCRGKTYPEISGRESVTVHADEPGRRNLSPEEVRRILVMSQTKQPSVIAEELGLKFPTVHSVVNRRTIMASQIAKELGMDAPVERPTRGRGPNVTNEEKAAINQFLDDEEGDVPASVIASKFGVSIRTAQHLKLKYQAPNDGKFGRAQIKGAK